MTKSYYIKYSFLQYIRIVSPWSFVSLKCLLSCFLILIAVNARAQQYLFINYDQSKLYLAKDSSQMMSFYKKLMSLGKVNEKK